MNLYLTFASCSLSSKHALVFIVVHFIVVSLKEKNRTEVSFYFARLAFLLCATHGLFLPFFLVDSDALEDDVTDVRILHLVQTLRPDSLKQKLSILIFKLKNATKCALAKESYKRQLKFSISVSIIWTKKSLKS